MSSLASDFSQSSYPSLQIEVTNRCNLHCLTCLHSISGINKASQDISQTALAHLQDSLQQTESVHLQGWGESTLLPELARYIRWFKAQGCRVSITSNGSLFTRSMLRDFIVAGLDGLTVSMAGASSELHDRLRGRGTHQKLWQGLEQVHRLKKSLSSTSPVVAVSYLLTPETLPELPQAVFKCRSLGVSLFAAVHLTHPVTRLQKTLRLWPLTMDRKVKHVFRAAHWQAFLGRIRLQLPTLHSSPMPLCDKNPLQCCFIAADGSVSPCVFLWPPTAGRDQDDDTDNCLHDLALCRFGTVATTRFEEIWQSRPYREFRAIFQQRQLVYDREMAKVGVDLDGIEQLERARENIINAFAKLPPPECCVSCPKMEGF